MNSNGYRLGSGDLLLDEKADHLMDNITFLSNERTYAKKFPLFSTIDYNGVDEEELIEAIEDLEKVYAKADHTAHQAHLYVLAEDNCIYHNDTRYGTDQITTAPICGGKTPLETLTNAWVRWSIPPVLVLNADYYCPGVDINAILKEVE